MSLDREWYWKMNALHLRAVEAACVEHGELHTAMIYRQGAESTEQWCARLAERSKQHDETSHALDH